MKERFRRREYQLAVVAAALAAAMGTVNPAFWSVSNAFDLAAGCVVMGIMALGALLVLISGGIDISFPAFAAFAMYSSTHLLLRFDPEASAAAAFILSAAIGAALGLVNAAFIAGFGLPALIVTLGSAGLARGALLAFVGTSIVYDPPESMIGFSQWTLFGSPEANGYGLPAPVFLVPALAAAVSLLLNRTVAGRGVYALGGNAEAARRAGFNVARIQIMVYTLAGAMAGIAGMAHACRMRNVNPFDLAGMELEVIAAVILGGAGITGGRGTVAGALLGVLLMVMIGNSLILMGIPSYWRGVAVGLLILAGAWASARGRRGLIPGVEG